MNVLDFQDRTAPIPMPSDAQLRRLATNLNHVTSYAALLLLSDRTTPFLAKQPIWRDRESLRLLRVVEKYLIPEVVRRLQANAKKSDKHGDERSYERDPWIRLSKTVIIVAVAAFAGFVAAYNLHAPNGTGDTRVSRSPEIRRAIPVELEIRRAIPVEPEIRKAIPVRTKDALRCTAHCD